MIFLFRKVHKVEPAESSLPDIIVDGFHPFQIEKGKPWSLGVGFMAGSGHAFLTFKLLRSIQIISYA